MSKLSIFISFFLISLLSLQSYAQEYGVQKIVRDSGFNLPSNERLISRQKVKRILLVAEKTDNQANEVEVDIEFFGLKDKFNINLEDFFTREDLAYDFFKETYVIESVGKYFLKEKIFVFTIWFETTWWKEQGIRKIGRTDYLQTFVDEDGDGIFETRHSQMPKVPKWVLQ